MTSTRNNDTKPTQNRTATRRLGRAALPASIFIAALATSSLAVAATPAKATRRATENRGPSASAPRRDDGDRWIVRIDPTREAEARRDLARVGARVTASLPSIEALAVELRHPVTPAAIGTLRSVRVIVPDTPLKPMSVNSSGNSGKGKGRNGNDRSDQNDREDRNDAGPDRNEESDDPGSLESIARVTGAQSLRKKGFTGRGVDIALIDTGVAPVPFANNVVPGADLSADAAATNLRFNDGYGHGTHIAGIINGRDPSVTRVEKAKGSFVGIAPNARIVNVKVGAFDGSVRTSQVVAALDWVVRNKSANGMNIRIINLSFGAPSTPDWRLDPLAWAAEIAWRRGVLVVAAAGNEGAGHELSSPAYSPQILSIGSTQVESDRGARSQYNVSPYTSSGTRRRPDLYLPGDHVASLRVKGSFVDTFLAQRNIDDNLTRGSGTSQATAVASGLAALLIEAYPTATPDQIKALLMDAAAGESGHRDRTGIETGIDVEDAWKAAKKGLPTVVVTDPFEACGATWCRGNGDGSQALTDWAKAAWNGSAWTGSAWTGSAWTGSAWTGSAWTGSAWTGSAWTGSAWTGSAWTGSAWTGSAWTGSAWTGSAWTGSAWTGSAWTGSAWTGSAWTGSAWSGSAWE